MPETSYYILGMFTMFLSFFICGFVLLVLACMARAKNLMIIGFVFISLAILTAVSLHSFLENYEPEPEYRHEPMPPVQTKLLYCKI